MADVFAKNTAVSAEEAAKIVPRAEFRVFGHGIIEIVQKKMWDAGAVLQKARRMPAETYFLSVHTNEANVKVRDGLLDIKTKVGESPEGYEIFQPRGKFQFPVKQADLATILSHLKAKMDLDRPAQGGIILALAAGGLNQGAVEPDLGELADRAPDGEPVAHLLYADRRQIRAEPGHRNELIEGVGFLLQGNLDIQVRQNGRQFVPLHGELELAPRLEDLVPLRCFTHFYLDIEQAVADLHIDFIGMHGQKIGFRRHFAGLLQDGTGVPHLCPDDVDDPLAEYAEFGPGDNLCGLRGGGGCIFTANIGHN